jgi:general secretion pathway protein K
MMAHRQRGVALLTAVVLVALATLTATAIAFNNAMTARRATAVFTATQAMLVAEGAEAMAAYALREDQKTSRLEDATYEAWSMPYGPVELDSGVVLQASLEDESGKFNINNLVDINGVADPLVREQFERLLASLGMETRWAALMTDWIDRDLQPTSPGGAEDSNYLGQNPPYRTANMPVTSVSELMALPGFGRDNYVMLLPYVTALPQGNRLNICDASGRLLDALIPGGKTEWDREPAGMAKKRETVCFPSLTDFEASVAPNDWKKYQKFVTRASQYYRLRTVVTIGTTRFTLYSLMHRDLGGQIRPVLRTFGTD